MRPFALLLALPLVAQAPEPLPLPAPLPSKTTLQEALKARRTERKLGGPALALDEAAALLWAAQGENRPNRRTVPSARARYPLELILVTEGSATLPKGSYRYLPKTHALARLSGQGVAELGGKLKGLQAWIAQSPSLVVVAGVPARLGGDARHQERYTFWEAGAASQALLLQAAALALGAGTASGLDLEALKSALPLASGEEAFVVLALGHPR